MVHIFLFHRVNPDFNPLWGSVHPHKFGEIIKFIARKYEVLSLESAWIGGKLAEKGRTKAMIVFDDGYKDYMNYALPVLKKYSCPSSMYVVVDSVETGLPPWTYLFDYQMLQTRKLSLSLDSAVLPVGLQEQQWKSPQERIAWSRKLKNALKRMPDKERRTICNQITKGFSDAGIPEGLMLNWQELEMLRKEGCCIGSHTMSHPLLATMEEEDSIRFELENSFRILKEKLGEAPITISYPNGSYDNRVVDIAKASGYKLGLAVGQRPFSDDPSFEIPRIDMYDGRLWRQRTFWYDMKFMLSRFKGI